MLNKQVLKKIVNSKIVISFSYGNYRNSLGGTDKLILSHQRNLNKLNISYLYFYPINNIRKLNVKFLNYWKVYFDGELCGVLSSSDMINFFAFLNKINNVKGIFIHHLLGIDIACLNRCIGAIDAPILFYIHDYYSICSQIHLMRNDEVYCGLGQVSEIKCKDCSYYSESNAKREKIETLLMKYKKRMKIIVPSMSAKIIWLSAFPKFDDQVEIIEHQKPFGIYTGNMKLIDKNDQLKIAYVGLPTNHKGWTEWVKIVKLIGKYHKDKALLYYFGDTNDSIEGVIRSSVSFQKGNLDAMITTLRQYGIDCVILWSKCPETYSFTYYESMASNAYIITNQFSGNIAESIKKNDNGLVLNNTEELEDLFINIQKLLDQINRFKMKKKYGPQRLLLNMQFISHFNYIRDDMKKHDMIKPNIRFNVLKWLLYLLYLKVTKS